MDCVSNYSDCLPILRTETVFYVASASTRFEPRSVDSQAGTIALMLWGTPDRIVYFIVFYVQISDFFVGSLL